MNIYNKCFLYRAGEFSCRANNQFGTVVCSANLYVEDRCQVDSSSFLDSDTLNRLTNRYTFTSLFISSYKSLYQSNTLCFYIVII